MAFAMKMKLKPKRILLVDDDQAVLEALGSGLQLRGYRVTTYANPSTALTEFVPRLYDIAVLDVRMAPMDGMELYRRLKGLDSHLAVCFLTAYADMITERPSGIRFLQKPISLSSLALTLEDIEAHH